jgi:broad specificity phosphatase PhoE
MSVAWKARAVISHVELDDAVGRCRRGPHLPSAVAKRIVDEVRECLFEPEAVAEDAKAAHRAGLPGRAGCSTLAAAADAARRSNMAKYVELRRHTDADGDVLTPEGVRAAVEIGARLSGGYALLVSTGAQRATQTLACFLAGCGAQVRNGVVVETGLRSEREDRWRDAYRKAHSGELGAMRAADPELVEEDSRVLGAALARVFDALSDGERALVVGHSPTNEAAVLGLTGEIVPPIAKGAGVLVIMEGAGYRVERLD